MESVIHGQCHCGEVTWRAELPPKLLLNCHCNMCRQLSGADYSSWVILADAQFSLTGGADKLQTYKVSASFSKRFCRLCGSTVSCVNNAKFPGHTYVARGNITGELDLPVNLQVYTDDKASWVNLDPEIAVMNP